MSSMARAYVCFDRAALFLDMPLSNSLRACARLLSNVPRPAIGIIAIARALSLIERSSSGHVSSPRLQRLSAFVVQCCADGRAWWGGYKRAVP